MASARLFAAFGMLALVAGCESTTKRAVENRAPFVETQEDENREDGATKPIEPPVTKLTEPPFAVTKVFFATDRNWSKNPREIFGVERGSYLSYGFCRVSIPRDHRMGHLEASSIWKLEFRKNPSKHVVLLTTTRHSKEKFFRDIAARVKTSNGKKAFLFVHGYNVTFEDAARRTAQMSYDLGFDGAPIFYSWPSQGTSTPLAYTTDEQTIEWAQSNLA